MSPCLQKQRKGEKPKEVSWHTLEEMPSRPKPDSLGWLVPALQLHSVCNDLGSHSAGSPPGTTSCPLWCGPPRLCLPVTRQPHCRPPHLLHLVLNSFLTSDGNCVDRSLLFSHLSPRTFHLHHAVLSCNVVRLWSPEIQDRLPSVYLG